APPTSPLVRSAWTRIAADDSANRALHALDSVSEEFVFAVAPVLTSAVWLWWGAVWAVPVGALMEITGAALVLAVGLRRGYEARPVFTDPIPASHAPADGAARPTWRAGLARSVEAYRS